MISDEISEIEVLVRVVVGNVPDHLVDERHLALRKLAILQVFAEDIAEDTAEVLVARL